MGANDVGGLFVVGFEDTFLSERLKTFLLDLKPAGVILFGRNIAAPIQVANLNRDLQLLAMDNWTEGLLIGVDQEGGRVRRLLSPFVSCPSALELASSSTPEELVRSYMTVTAHEMKLVGFNTNFVPVLDLVGQSSQLRTSVIGDRSFGEDPLSVGLLGQIVVESLRSMGIIACGKHFPGHGGTTVDSHLELPVDTRGVQTLRQRDMVPFQSVIDNGIEMIMTAHVVYSSLDPTYPATLSNAIVNVILRSRMGYKGVVITDDLDMGAIANHYDTEQCAKLAVKAGADILLFSKSGQKALAARDGLARSVETGEIPRHTIEQSLRRIRNLKERYKAQIFPGKISGISDYFRS